jgi:hypothetical protein
MTKLIDMRGIMQSAIERFKGLRLKISERASEIKLKLEEPRVEGEKLALRQEKQDLRIIENKLHLKEISCLIKQMDCK